MEKINLENLRSALNIATAIERNCEGVSFGLGMSLITGIEYSEEESTLTHNNGQNKRFPKIKLGLENTIFLHTNNSLEVTFQDIEWDKRVVILEHEFNDKKRTLVVSSVNCNADEKTTIFVVVENNVPLGYLEFDGMYSSESATNINSVDKSNISYTRQPKKAK